MKLTKALKLKNELAGEVAELKQRLSKQNCRPATVPFDYAAGEVLDELRAKIDQLVDVKAAIAVANAEHYDAIFQLAELKGLVVSLKALDVRHGVFTEGGSFTSASVTIEYVAQLKKATVDALVAEFETEISALQDQLDDFNHERSVELSE